MQRLFWRVDVVEKVYYVSLQWLQRRLPRNWVSFPWAVYGCLTANMKVTKSQSKPKPSSSRGALGKRTSVIIPFMESSPVMKNLHWGSWIWVESLRKETLLSNFANTADFSNPKYDRCRTDTSLKGTLELVPALRRFQSCCLTLFD